ncbi:ribosomal protein S18 acetylase RimI-like enzyme [Diaminobutyricimonas aerilata]|uniref:Ribosomal protein S18 acetylase RimI-like enzyme n=1 Tax=Diaminobutyricimonas aerilata TaxID=1162967 RepID=A0A2M9CKX8_9MICO|nr:GNAT family N-acetyltransferase [Diaminobutyricimonas aerilata]PJJ72532.1 ribosomal protein S18 acetylase RimI-like enzyme [Diaminobutyricimonas aerilata]
MATWREAAVTDDAALALLTEYFSARAQEFPADLGEYRTVFPDPAQFVPPRGVFLIVEGDDIAGEAADIGCGGIRELPVDGDARRFEVKHLWIQPHARKRGLGRALLAELERRAREFGATELVLDTNASLEAAGALYRSSGYAEVPPYNDNPNATHWFRKPLD